ncbi:MAG: helix-turn-helix transcriptional regulator [Clostridia bacterium]|nr:helix-turn-helix transcriptional regulator [Clostridia bacterium]
MLQTIELVINKYSFSPSVFGSAKHLKNLTHQIGIHASYELCYCLNGEISLFVNGKTQRLHKQEAILLPSYCLHSTATEKQSEEYIFVFSPLSIPHFDSWFKNKKTQDATWQFDPATVYYAQKMLIETKAPDDIHFTAGINLLLYDFIEKNTFENKDCRSSDIFTDALQYIDKFFCQELTLEKVAKGINVSKNYVSKKINEAGFSFPQLLKTFRLSHAEQLLIETNSPVTAIANASGYNNIKTFYIDFKERNGCSPLEFRKRSLPPPTGGVLKPSPEREGGGGSRRLSGQCPRGEGGTA